MTDEVSTRRLRHEFRLSLNRVRERVISRTFFLPLAPLNHNLIDRLRASLFVLTHAGRSFLPRKRGAQFIIIARELFFLFHFERERPEISLFAMRGEGKIYRSCEGKGGGVVVFFVVVVERHRAAV